MKIVSFQNKGLIDPVAITTFGVNAKGTDNPFGFFGTGLKYAIAILLRNGCEISIYRGYEIFEFSTEKHTVRGKEFDVVIMHRHDRSTITKKELGFTLDLGKTWELWQAFRELYCNAMDEGGHVYGNAVETLEDYTTIVVRGDAFYQEYINREHIMIVGQPQSIQNNIEIFDKSSLYVFYQGIRVGQLPRPSVFTYNFLKDVQLTEDRTVKNVDALYERIRQTVTYGEDAGYIRTFVTAPQDSLQGSLDMNWYETPSETCMEVIKDIGFSKLPNPTLADYYNKHRPKAPVKPEPVAKCTEIEQAVLLKAVDFCETLDYKVGKYPIVVTNDLGTDTLGMADCTTNTIYIARRGFEMGGAKQVAAILIEEFLHLDKGYHDKTYEMQNYLFEKIVSLGELYIGVAL